VQARVAGQHLPGGAGSGVANQDAGNVWRSLENIGAVYWSAVRPDAGAAVF
jgi:hypothetical protein